MHESQRRQLADEGLADYLAMVQDAKSPSCRQQGAVALRASAEARAARRPAGPDLYRVTDQVVSDLGVPTRLYLPSDERVPLLVFMHGGGWVNGDLTSHDRLCRRIAVAANVAVLAIDFRRAPEAPWPAPVDDCVAVTGWAIEHAAELVGSPRVAVCGDSAGGNLAALTCLRLRDLGGPLPIGQVLIYPNTDLTLTHSSVAAKAAGWGLDADDALWFAEQFVSDPGLRTNPRVSPVFEPDLAGLPPAVVITAEHDVLRDEGDAYADALRAAGVPVAHRCEPGLIHGFLGLDLQSAAAAAACDRVFNDIAVLLHR
jgi:acetyl esterase